MLKFFIIFAALILLLSALGINLYGQKEATSESALSTNTYIVIETAKVVWSDYIVRPVKYVWNTYVIPFVTGKFLDGLKQKHAEQTTLQPE